MKNLIVFLLFCIIPFLFGHCFDLHWTTQLILVMCISIYSCYGLKVNKSTLYFMSFFATFIVWFVYSWYFDHSNQHLIYNKVSEILKIKSIYSLMFVQAFFGALMSLFASFVSLWSISPKTIRKYLRVS
jgi:hypothetical protein